MKPILFTVFGKNIYSYGTMIAVGIIAAILLLQRRVKQRGYDDDSVSNMAIITIIAGILGGKLFFIFTELKHIKEDPSILSLKDMGSGFVIYGAVIVGALAIYLYCKKKKWSVLDVLDMIVPTVALAQGFGRIGCFLAGCCYGKATSLPIGVEFKNSPYAPAGVFRHPTQLYSSAFDFALAFFLIWYDKKNKKQGRTFAMYFIIYSVGRFIVEFLRDDPRGSVGVLSTSQFISIFVIIFALIIYNIDKFKIKKQI